MGAIDKHGFYNGFPENFRGVRSIECAIESLPKRGKNQNLSRAGKNLIKYFHGIKEMGESDDPIAFVYAIYSQPNTNYKSIEAQLDRYLPSDIEEINFKHYFDKYFGWGKNALRQNNNSTSNQVDEIIQKLSSGCKIIPVPEKFTSASSDLKDRVKNILVGGGYIKEADYNNILYELIIEYGRQYVAKAIRDISQDNHNISLKLSAHHLNSIFSDTIKNEIHNWWKEKGEQLFLENTKKNTRIKISLFQTITSSYADLPNFKKHLDHLEIEKVSMDELLRIINHVLGANCSDTSILQELGMDIGVIEEISRSNKRSTSRQFNITPGTESDISVKKGLAMRFYSNDHHGNARMTISRKPNHEIISKKYIQNIESIHSGVLKTLTVILNILKSRNFPSSPIEFINKIENDEELKERFCKSNDISLQDMDMLLGDKNDAMGLIRNGFSTRHIQHFLTVKKLLNIGLSCKSINFILSYYEGITLNDITQVVSDETTGNMIEKRLKKNILIETKRSIYDRVASVENIEPKFRELRGYSNQWKSIIEESKA